VKEQGGYLCSFSVGLDELPRKKRTRENVLRLLLDRGRFSVFEATSNAWIAETMDSLIREKLIEVDNSPGFPWSNVRITAAGRKDIEATPGNGTVTA